MLQYQEVSDDVKVLLSTAVKISEKSVNTENQERIFQQAKQIALKCTNRKPENVIPSVLIRLQAKEITGKLSNIYHSAITRVENVSNKTPSNKTPAFTGTVISKCYIESRSNSWQAHLSRISAYLVSKNVWWKAAPNSFVFFYGDKDLECRVEGPTLNPFATIYAYMRTLIKRLTCPYTHMCVKDGGAMNRVVTTEARACRCKAFIDSRSVCRRRPYLL